MNVIGDQSKAPSHSESVKYCFRGSWPDYLPQAWDRRSFGFVDPRVSAPNVANTQVPYAQARVLISGMHESREVHTYCVQRRCAGNCQIRAVVLPEVVIADLATDGT